MNRVFFPYDDYPVLSLNVCKAETDSDPRIGIVYMASGFLYQIFYVPCLIVIGRDKHLQHSCFKIMLYLGVVDNLCLFVNAMLCGYFSYAGLNFCTNPLLFYVSGCVALSLWCNNCATCVLLGLNRCVDLWRWRPMVKVFAGNRTWFMLAGAFCYSLYFFLFTNPLIYSSKYHTWFFNPLMDSNDKNTSFEFHNTPHTINNFATVLILSVLYIGLCMKIVLTSKKATFPSTRIVGRMQKQIFFQSFVICMINMSAAVIYVYMQDNISTKFIYIFAQFAWQASHGSIAFVYLTMNRTIRRGVWNLVKSVFEDGSIPIHAQVIAKRSSHRSTTTPLDVVIQMSYSKSNELVALTK